MVLTLHFFKTKKKSVIFLFDWVLLCYFSAFIIVQVPKVVDLLQTCVFLCSGEEIRLDREKILRALLMTELWDLDLWI